MLGELRNLGGEVGDRVADRPGHVEARLLSGRAGPPQSAAQSRGPLELCDQRVAFGAAPRLPAGIAPEYGFVELVIQLSKTASVLPDCVISMV